MTRKEKLLIDLKTKFNSEEIQRDENIISLYELIETLKMYKNNFPVLFDDIKKDVNKINKKSSVSNIIGNKVPKLKAITINSNQNNNIFITYVLDCKYNLLFIVKENEIKQIYYSNDLINNEFNNYLETPDEIKNFYVKNINMINKYIYEVVTFKEKYPNIFVNFASDRKYCPNQTFNYKDELISCNINMDELDDISIKFNLNYYLQEILNNDLQRKLFDLVNNNKDFILKRTPINIKNLPSEIRSYINNSNLENNKTLTMHKN